MTSEPLLFTPELMARAQANARPFGGATFLEQLALFWGEDGARMRAQVERCAKRVPEEKRARVLTPISAPSVQASAALNQLLLACVLEDNGWAVEHEPGLDGLTPDLLITKGEARFLIEVVQFAQQDPDAPQVAWIRDAFVGRTTHRPISIVTASIEGSASLRPFVDYVMGFDGLSRMRRRRRFRSQGVHVLFDLHPSFDAPMPVIFGWGGRTRYGLPKEEIRERIARKVKKYKAPIIVALDVVGVVHPQHATDEAFYGTTTYNYPFDPERGVDVGVEATMGRLLDGLLNQRGRDGDRVRERLVAVLPFEVDHALDNDLLFRVAPALLANPLHPQASLLRAFSPIPRFVATTPLTAAGFTMRWFGEGDSDWPGASMKARGFIPG